MIFKAHYKTYLCIKENLRKKSRLLPFSQSQHILKHLKGNSTLTTTFSILSILQAGVFSEFKICNTILSLIFLTVNQVSMNTVGLTVCILIFK